MAVQRIHSALHSPLESLELMDALTTVIDALGRCGVAAFPAYGTLLGAVRAGKVIGHDNDADVGYISGHTHPVDVIRESFRLQRELCALGFEIEDDEAADEEDEPPAKSKKKKKKRAPPALPIKAAHFSNFIIQ